MNANTLPGKSYPLGATMTRLGVNFCVFSQHATGIELLLFDGPEDPAPARTIKLDPATNRTFYYWHVEVPGLRAGQLYGFRVYGPFDPAQGHRFDGEKILIDPYARAISTRLYDRASACKRGDNVARALRAIVVDPSTYNWEDDAPPVRHHERAVIYEMHVGAFTKNRNSGVRDDLRGTFRGLIERIPYLVELGINTVELLPVAQFDPQDAPAGLTNVWGYNPIAFMAPHSQYAVHGDPLAAVDEFRDMVKALHRAGISVFLDVVFNHSTENGSDGPTLSFRGFENVAYYIPGGTPASYANYSGCGNTLNANHSIVRRLVLDSLSYWVTEMHVDGFRFDLASALSRGEFGEPLASPPLLWSIESDPVLAGTAVVAEAWDAGGLYQVGTFIGDRFAEWNGHFRDDIRSFVKGDPGMALKTSLRIAGSPDLFPRTDRNVRRTVNFVTSHDGFTLNDLVSYNQKHNRANGEQNRDGANDNQSWNCGAEGPSTDPEINALRTRQIKNFLTILFLSQGTPMLLMGDEVRRTQNGNNNVYGQDNALSWFDWDDLEESAEILRFSRKLLHFHRSVQILHASAYLPQKAMRNEPSLTFHGRKLGHPEWNAEARWLGFCLNYPAGGEQLHVILNAFWEPVEFEVPRLKPPVFWRRVICTAAESPQDIQKAESAPIHSDATYLAPPRSATVFQAWPLRPRRRTHAPPPHAQVTLCHVRYSCTVAPHTAMHRRLEPAAQQAPNFPQWEVAF